jgi:hypothetical protein
MDAGARCNLNNTLIPRKCQDKIKRFLVAPARVRLLRPRLQERGEGFLPSRARRGAPTPRISLGGFGGDAQRQDAVLRPAGGAPAHVQGAPVGQGEGLGRSRLAENVAPGCVRQQAVPASPLVLLRVSAPLRLPSDRRHRLLSIRVDRRSGRRSADRARLDGEIGVSYRSNSEAFSSRADHDSIRWRIRPSQWGFLLIAAKTRCCLI